MAITAYSSPVSGLWPLGKITVAAAGTAVALNTNVGAQTNGTATTRPSGNVNQIILTCPSANTLMTYVLRKVNGLTVSKANTNFIVAVLNPGQSISLPAMQMVGTAINLDDYMIDADTNANSLFASAVVGR